MTQKPVLRVEVGCACVAREVSVERGGMPRRPAPGPPLYLLSAVAKLELELIQSHLAQKPVLRGEVGCACVAREVSVEREWP